MSRRDITPRLFEDLYREFDLPLSAVDCGQKCGPFNDHGVPVCCDIRLVIPTAYQEEWAFLEPVTNLWKRWEGDSSPAGKELLAELQNGQVTLQCVGHQACQRPFRTISCRSFPFFPYLNRTGQLVGLTYYREYRQECWIISNLSTVTLEYKKEFQSIYQRIFELFPEALRSYQDYCAYLRKTAEIDQEDLILMDFWGKIFSLQPGTDNKREISYQDLPSYGPFEVTKDLVFPDEE